MEKSLFSQRLKELRENSGLSQTELGKMLAVSQQTVASWEVSRTEPSNQILEEISDFFGVSIDYLLGRRDIRFKDGFASESVFLLQRAAKENGLNDSALDDILNYAKFKYPDKFKGLN